MQLLAFRVETEMKEMGIQQLIFQQRTEPVYLYAECGIMQLV